MRYATIVFTAFTGFVLASSAARAETVEDVEKKLAEAMTKHKSVELKMKTKMNISNPQFTQKSESDSSVIYAKKGDKWLSRLEVKTTGTQKMGDNPEEKVDSKVLSVCDGEFTYTLTEAAQIKQAMKTRQPAINWFGKEMWEERHKHFDVKLLPDDTVDGKSVWVIESRPKLDKDTPPEAKAAMEGTRAVSYYRKSDGVEAKSLSYDKDGKVTMTNTVTEVKFDGDLKPDTFKFTPPEGVTVMDMTKVESQPAEAQAEPAKDASAEEKKPAAEEKKQEPAEEKKEEPKKKKGVGGLLKKLK